MPGRTWGYWTKGKLDILQQYLDSFTTATKKSSERIYIDIFAGEPENRDRLTGEPIEGSATIALSVDDPPFTRLRFFETIDKAPKLRGSLLGKFNGRDIKFIGGDCNEKIISELESIKRWNWAPTFAFIDPTGMEAEWRTIKVISQFRNGSYKTEIFLLFPAPMFMRVLPTDGSRASEINIEKIYRMYGTEDWLNIYQARLEGELKPSQARYEYLNLMRWRLKRELGYQWTHPIEVRNEAGNIIYYLIFATDNEVGDRIMKYIYARAAAEFPKMRAEARSLRRQLEYESRGQMSLDVADNIDLQAPIQPGENFYKHEPPSRPWFL